jgi:arylsulfatase B/arylsulfatase I/J
MPLAAGCCCRCLLLAALTGRCRSADFGWHDIGFHNNTEVKSPTIDALARDGLLLGRHYAYKVCCPTRSSFISGRLPIHVNVDNQNGVAELNGVDIRMTTIAEKLKQGGYATHAAGKWHAGAHLHGQLPLQRGFDSFVGFLQGWCESSHSFFIVLLKNGHLPRQTRDIHIRKIQTD